MAIHADTLLDRIQLKAQVNRWRLLAVLFAIFAAIAVSERHAFYSPIERPFVARLSVEGFIEDNRDLYDLIDRVSDNPKARAVILWIDTPGGSAVGGEEIFQRLRIMSERKPVVAVMRSVAASAGYMIALGADHIVAREGTITGSIGVLMETFEATQLAEKIGIKPIVIKSGPLKAAPNPLEKNTPEATRMIEETIYDFQQRFIDMVAERRKLSRPQAIALADGRIFSGKRALDHKLIDALGGEEEALNWLIEKRQIEEDLDIKDVSLQPAMGWAQQWAESVAGYFLQNNRMPLDGLRAIWHSAR